MKHSSSMKQQQENNSSLNQIETDLWWQKDNEEASKSIFKSSNRLWEEQPETRATFEELILLLKRQDATMRRNWNRQKLKMRMQEERLKKHEENSKRNQKNYEKQTTKKEERRKEKISVFAFALLFYLLPCCLRLPEFFRENPEQIPEARKRRTARNRVICRITLDCDWERKKRESSGLSSVLFT